ncbi:MAG: hypothetical protein NTV22_13080 [bacterium]|nr:hypothetical protein [bacterium]
MKLLWLAIYIVVLAFICTGYSCTITYEWLREDYLGASRIKAYPTNNIYYVSVQRYTVQGVWKGLKDGKLDRAEVPSDDVENVVMWDDFHPGETFDNNALIGWTIPEALILLKPTLTSLESGYHTYKVPEVNKGTDHSGNQLTKPLTFVAQN